MVEFDLRQCREEQKIMLGEKFSAENRFGHSIAVSNQGLVIDGKPFFGITGEIHYCRVRPDQWEDTLRKAKCGGINIVATYVFWNVHEEEQGVFRFDGCRDLRRFLTLCKKHGLMVILRIGPFDHGEMRNGGLPDWLYGMPFEVRSNDEGYLFYTRRLYAAIHSQVNGLYFSQGGPVIGIQLENEYMHSSAPWETTTGVSNEWVNGGEDGEDHIRALKKIAMEEGLIAPFYTCTAWGGAMAPADEVLPLWGGYAYWPWIFYSHTGEHPCTPEYIYRDNHSNAVPKTYNFEPRYQPESMPYACCEMMGGMMCSYNYRFTLPAESVDALANIKLGSGCSLLGYYMYRGGTTPTGRRTPFLNEGQVNKRSYDYQAPIGEFGQRRESYYRLRTLHDFCVTFADDLLGSSTVLPDSANDMQPEDTAPLRCCVRMKGKSGFLFLNNFQDHLAMPERQGEEVKLTLADEELRFTVDLASGENAILPFYLDMGGLMLKQAAVQPVTRLHIQGQEVWFFQIPRGMKPELRFAAADVLQAEGIAADKEENAIVIRPAPDTVSDFRVNGKRIILLPREQAMRFSHICREGQDLAVLSDSGILWDGTEAFLETEAEDPAVLTFPAPDDAELRIGPFGGRRFKARSSARPVACTQVGPGRWSLAIPQETLFGHKTVLLRVSCIGNIAQAFINGEMVSDNFCNGQPWDIRLDCYREQLAEHPLTIYIVPIKEGASVSVDSAMAARMEHVKGRTVSLESAELCFIDEIRLKLPEVTEWKEG